jgi:hypothetical protein
MLGHPYLVEVDAHALKLEVRGAIVAMSRSEAIHQYKVTSRGEAYTPLLSRPCSPEICCLFQSSASM